MHMKTTASRSCRLPRTNPLTERLARPRSQRQLSSSPRRELHLAEISRIGWLALFFALWSAANPLPIHAQTCSPTGTPISRSTVNDHYFTYNGHTLVLGGLSYEYLCHVPIPSTTQWYTQYCALGNSAATLATMDSNNNTIMRISTIFNTSPGMYLGYKVNGVLAPFPYEQPFKWNGSKWDLSAPIDPTYLSNLQSLMCTAYNNWQFFVEVTLLDPWNPNLHFTISPFNPVNTITGNQGFTASQYFGDESTDATIPQNKTARGYQKAAVKAIVNALKGYPNVIWQLANEPDLGPATIANVMQWQADMASVVQLNDSNPPHLLMINGHTSSSFGWNVTGALVQTAHYTQINSAGNDGAIALMNDPAYVTRRAQIALGFDENQDLPNANYPSRMPADVRAEAWEFLMGGGGLFDGYSTDMSSSLAQQANVQVGGVTSYLNYTYGLPYLGQTLCNSTGSWCSLAAYGAQEAGRNCTTTPTANVYFGAVAASARTDNRLYIHHGQLMSSVPGGPVKFDGFHELSCGNGSSSGYKSTIHVTVPTTSCYLAIWFDPVTFVQLLDQKIVLQANTPTALTPPYYTDDVLLEFEYWNAGGRCVG
jgi:hypothetical protein